MTTKSIEHTLELHFADIFKRHEYRLYTLAFHLTKSDQYAKDIIQDVFLKLWEHRNNLYAIHNVETWLYKLTENRVVDFLRKTSIDRRLRDALWVNMQHHTENEAEDDMFPEEYNLIIEKVIDQLPPQRKRIYQLRKENCFNYGQITQELQRSGQTVKSKFISAIRYLKQLFNRGKSNL